MAKKQDDFDTPNTDPRKFRITVTDNGRTMMQYPSATLVKAEGVLLEFTSSGNKTVIVSGTWMAEEE